MLAIVQGSAHFDTGISVSIMGLKALPNLYINSQKQSDIVVVVHNISGSIQQSTSIPVFKSRYMKNYFTQ